MKRASVVLIILLSLSVLNGMSQKISYEIEVNYNINQGITTADISVRLTEGTPDFTYYLMTNDPLNGTIITQSEPTKKKNYVFKGVKPGKYFLKIMDNSGIQAGKTVNVVENQM
ncbi:MAG: hypothetical protein JW973_03350 [Bacteroidales bacterium]|nr:hypothetical protein [Bacteroidales bacterium]